MKDRHGNEMKLGDAVSVVEICREFLACYRTMS
jgi:hypothetical protein